MLEGVKEGERGKREKTGEKEKTVPEGTERVLGPRAHENY